MSKKAKKAVKPLKIDKGSTAKPKAPQTRTITGRVLLLRTDGNTVSVVQNTMQLLELRSALQLLLGQVEASINAAANASNEQADKAVEPKP